MTPIIDEYQIREQQIGFNGLVHSVCSDGHKTMSARLLHTLSFYAVTCPDVGIPIPDQQAILTATLRSIIFGQIVYGNAAISGRVQDPSGTKIGDVISIVLPAPPIIRRDWPSRVLYVPVPDSQGLRLRVESMGPAVDNWDRFWFLRLCEEGKAQFLREVNLQDHMASFHMVYHIQGNVFQFNAFGPLDDHPTWATFMKAIDALRESVLLPYVAHDLQYNLVDSDGLPLGVGYFDVFKEPSPNAILSSDQANSTIAITITGLDGAKLGGGDRSSA